MAILLTVDKAIDILEEVVAAKGGLGTRSLARSLDLNVATVHNIAKTLVARGFLQQDELTKRFHAGLRLMMLGRHAGYLEQLAIIGKPHVRALAELLDESVMLGAIDRGHLVNLHYVPSRQALRVEEPQDLREIAHCTAVGKLMLAEMEPEVLHASLAEMPLKKFTARTIVTREALQNEIAIIRKRGYSTTRDEMSEGVSAVAVPINDPWGSAVGALAASAPTIRMDRPDQQHKTLKALRAAAAEIMRVWSVAGDKEPRQGKAASER